MSHTLSRPSSELDWRDYHAIRRDVLWTARGRSGYDEGHLDEHLPHNHPLLLKLAGRSIGTTRLDDWGDGTGIVRLVAIAPDLQRQGHGRVLAQLTEDVARVLEIRTLLVNAAPEALGYYERMGWHHHDWEPERDAAIAAGLIQLRKWL